MAELKVREYVVFEDIKHMDENGEEFWLARELQVALGYAQWRRFSSAIDRAMLACKNSGHEISNNFIETSKSVEMPTKPRRSEQIGFADVGKTKTKSIPDYKLTRYACYLIVQNGDPRKEVIALGQTYFAIQTRRAEVADYFNALDEDNRRLVVRGDIKQWNQMLAETAHNAGVITNEEFAVFQNAGYMGLYGGETVEDIHERKGLGKNERILDFMSSNELVANLFRITQADEKIKNEQIQGADNAIDAHFEVGKIVRDAINQTGGTMPENMQTPKCSITEIEREQLNKMKKSKTKMLDE
ncbi:MAG: DNA damage-inducible protein D [Bacillota bacterium]